MTGPVSHRCHHVQRRLFHRWLPGMSRALPENSLMSAPRGSRGESNLVPHNCALEKTADPRNQVVWVERDTQTSFTSSTHITPAHRLPMTTTTTEAPLQQLTEHVDDWRTPDLLVDAANRLVRHVALTGVHSRNGYRYSEQALRQAIPLYENKPVFLDHAANFSRPYDRSTRDLAGSIVEPRYQDGRIRADIQLLDTEAGRTFLALAEANRPAVGMSHVILAHRSSDKSIVEEIHDVVSVDAVVFPATTSTFREQTDEQPPGTLPGSVESILSEIDANLPDHIRRLVSAPSAGVWRAGLFPDLVLVDVRKPEAAETEQYAIQWNVDDGCVKLSDSLAPVSREQIEDGRWIAERRAFCGSEHDDQTAASKHARRLQVHFDAVLAERDELQKQVDGFERAQQTVATQQEVDRLLDKSQLPAYAVTELLRRQLLEAPTEEAREALISERQLLLKRCSGHSPLSRERIDGAEPELGDSIIVSAIKQHRFSVLAGVG